MLIASEKQLKAFVSTLFRYADPSSYISLRAFDQNDRGRPALLIEGVQVGTNPDRIVTQAKFAAERAANEEVPAVFAPPVATFNNARTARSADVMNGVAISVEVDSGDPKMARTRLEQLLGPVTIAIHSGGEWMDPETGEFYDKVHLHWRLSEPTTEPADHVRLQYAREIAARLVGGDPTAAPPAHPLRWPGSWNRKATPKLARIFAGNPAAEVHLEDAIGKLEDAIEAAGLKSVGADGPRISSDTPSAAVALLASALEHVPNSNDTHWDEWVRVGMAMWRATGGSSDGLNAWCEWSAKSKKHEDQACVDRWNHFAGSPPTRIGAGSIIFQATQNGWQRPEAEVGEPPELDDHYWQEFDKHAEVARQWHDYERITAGEPTPALPEMTDQAADLLLWKINQGWEEADIEPRRWIAKGYLMRGAVTVVSGPGSAGKSSLMVAWSSCMALGCAFQDFKVPGPMKVGIYNVEDDAMEQKRRFSAMAQMLHTHVKAFMPNLTILGPANVGTLLYMAPDGRRMLNTPVMDALTLWIETTKPDVLILDPFVELHAQEENDNTAIRAVMANLRTLAATHSMAVVILHHARKGETTPGDPDSLRGASSIVGAARIVLTLNVMTKEEAESFNVSLEHRRDYFRLDGAKSNYAPLEEAEWFQRSVRDLANSDGVAVAWPWKPPSVWKDMTAQDIAAALDRIAAGPTPGILYAPTNRGANNSRWVGNPIMQILNLNEQQAYGVVKTWLRNGLLTETTYRDPASRKDVKGVVVDRSKAP